MIEEAGNHLAFADSTTLFLPATLHTVWVISITVAETLENGDSEQNERHIHIPLS